MLCYRTLQGVVPYCYNDDTSAVTPMQWVYFPQINIISHKYSGVVSHSGIVRHSRWAKYFMNYYYFSNIVVQLAAVVQHSHGEQNISWIIVIIYHKYSSTVSRSMTPSRWAKYFTSYYYHLSQIIVVQLAAAVQWHPHGKQNI